MAEQILRQLAEKNKLPVTVSSAGVAAMTGDPITPESAEAMKTRGYKVTTHKAKDLTPKLLEEADLVLTATLDHRSEIARMLPKASKYSFTIDEYARLVSFLSADPEFSDEFKKKASIIKETYFAGKEVKVKEDALLNEEVDVEQPTKAPKINDPEMAMYVNSLSRIASKEKL